MKIMLFVLNFFKSSLSSSAQFFSVLNMLNAERVITPTQPNISITLIYQVIGRAFVPRIIILFANTPAAIPIAIYMKFFSFTILV